jgi:hypothetical protein
MSRFWIFASCLAITFGVCVPVAASTSPAEPTFCTARFTGLPHRVVLSGHAVKYTAALHTDCPGNYYISMFLTDKNGSQWSGQFNFTPASPEPKTVTVPKWGDPVVTFPTVGGHAGSQEQIVDIRTPRYSIVRVTPTKVTISTSRNRQAVTIKGKVFQSNYLGWSGAEAKKTRLQRLAGGTWKNFKVSGTDSNGRVRFHFIATTHARYRLYVKGTKVSEAGLSPAARQ